MSKPTSSNKPLYDRNDPPLWEIAGADDALPLDPTARRYWLKNLHNPTRLYLLPLLRLTTGPLMWLCLLVKRVLPFQFHAYGLLHRIIYFFMKYFVTPEANWLIVRHLGVESNILNFIIANSPYPHAPQAQTYPRTIADIRHNALLDHDLNLYNAVADTSGWPEDWNRGRPVDYSPLRPLQIKVNSERKRWTQFLDMESAIELVKLGYCLLHTEREFERAVNSFQFDATLAERVARITGDRRLVHLVENPYTLYPAGAGGLARRLVLHALFCEYLHASLEAKAGQAGFLRAELAKVLQVL